MASSLTAIGITILTPTILYNPQFYRVSPRFPHPTLGGEISYTICPTDIVPLQLGRQRFIAISKLFRNRNFIFMLSIILGLAIGQGAVWTKPLMLPALAVSMTLSTISITNRDLISIKNAPRLIPMALLLNYVVLGGVMLLLARWLIVDPDIRLGFMVIAAMPPAISVVPFSYMLGGNTVFALLGTTGLYLAALGLTPAITMLLVGTDFLKPTKLLVMLVQLIVIPLAISRILLFKGLAQNINKWRDTVINWCVFIVTFTMIGLNREIFFGQLDVLLKVVIIAAAVTFGIGHATHYIAGKLHIDHPTNISWVVISTRKNTGLASLVAIAFLSERAAFPAAVCAIFEVLSIIWWGFYFKREAK